MNFKGAYMVVSLDIISSYHPDSLKSACARKIEPCFSVQSRGCTCGGAYSLDFDSECVKNSTPYGGLKSSKSVS